jgi:hypothetical protein
MTASRIAASAALVLTVGFLAAVPAHERTTSSSCAVALGTEVCTWVVLQGATPVELGATIPLSLIEGVPADAPMVWPPEELVSLPMPAAAREGLGIDHLGINWEAHGHPPATFMTRHFDFHFYSISDAEVRAIDCADSSKPVDLPASYALPDIDVPGMGAFIGLCVPNMGMHAMHASQVEETAPFEASMILGYYSGRPIFFEPMVSQRLLLERADFTLEMPVPHGLPAGVRYPSSFRAEYLAGSDSYQLVFSGFVAAASR